jgi:hypothetical protein
MHGAAARAAAQTTKRSTVFNRFSLCSLALALTLLTGCSTTVDDGASDPASDDEKAAALPEVSTDEVSPKGMTCWTTTSGQCVRQTCCQPSWGCYTTNVRGCPY